MENGLLYSQNPTKLHLMKEGLNILTEPKIVIELMRLRYLLWTK